MCSRLARATNKIFDCRWRWADIDGDKCSWFMWSESYAIHAHTLTDTWSIRCGSHILPKRRESPRHRLRLRPMCDVLWLWYISWCTQQNRRRPRYWLTFPTLNFIFFALAVTQLCDNSFHFGPHIWDAVLHNLKIPGRKLWLNTIDVWSNCMCIYSIMRSANAEVDKYCWRHVCVNITDWCAQIDRRYARVFVCVCVYLDTLIKHT